MTTQSFYNVQDLVPWSLIYDAQNKKHLEELGTLKEDNQEFVNIILRVLISQYHPIHNLKENQRFHYMWGAIKQYVTEEKIYAAMEDEIQMHMDNCSDTIGKIYPGHERTLRELHMRRAEGFKRLLRDE